MNYIISRLEFLKLGVNGKLSIFSFFLIFVFFVYKQIIKEKENIIEQVVSIKGQMKKDGNIAAPAAPTTEEINKKNIIKYIEIFISLFSSLFTISVLTALSLSLFFISLNSFLTGIISFFIYSFIYFFFYSFFHLAENDDRREEKKTFFDKNDDVVKYIFYCFKVFLFQSVFFMFFDRLSLDEIKRRRFIFFNFFLYLLALFVVSIINKPATENMIKIRIGILSSEQQNEINDFQQKLFQINKEREKNYRYMNFFYFSFIFFYFFELKYNFLSFVDNLLKNPKQFFNELNNFSSCFLFSCLFPFIISLFFFYSFDCIQSNLTKEEINKRAGRRERRN